MNKVAKFEKVSLEQYLKDYTNTNNMNLDDVAEAQITNIYADIELPVRATTGSAGYDFHMPFGVELAPGASVNIPTGIRCSMDDGYVLLVFPRSSLGFKYRETISNTIPVIDSDYYGSDNEGHIFMKIINCGDKVMEIKKGDAFVQGIFVPYGITVDDNVVAIRNGGMGSTGR